MCNFTTKDWQGEVDFAKEYREVLEKEFTRYQQQLTDTTELAIVKASIDPAGDYDLLDEVLDSQPALPTEVEQENNEITRYLTKG